MNAGLVGAGVAALGYTIIAVNAFVNGSPVLGVAMLLFGAGAFLVGFL